MADPDVQTSPREAEEGAPAPVRTAWISPETDDYEIAPEAAMYSGRRDV